MPPTQEMIRKAILCFGQMRLVKFTADKTQITPGEEVKLSWEVTLPDDCRVTIQLNGVDAGRKSSRIVSPVSNITYRLEARAAGMGRMLGTIQIQVDTSNCTQNEIEEATIAPLVVQNINTSIDEYNNVATDKYKVYKRREAQVEVESTGIIIRLRLKIEVPNFSNPDLDIDAKIAVGVAADGRVLAFYRSFAVDVDWPWWVTGISLGISDFIEVVVESYIEKELKNTILTSLKSNLESAAELYGGTISSVETAQDKIIITTC